MSNKPTSGMVSEAEKGLAWRKEHGRGGTEVGIARARDISNGKNLSDDTVKRMYSFFSRHEVDKKAEGFSPGEKGYPSNGRIAWALWGGDAGFSWSRKIAQKLDNDRSDELISDESHAKGDHMTDEVVNEEVIEQEERSEEISVASDADVPVEETLTIEEERKCSAEVVHRSMGVDMKPIDEEKRTVRIAVSSEEPVQRSFGTEVLEHSDDAIDLSFLNSGRAPLLLDHDPEKQIGVIESASLDGDARRLRAVVRFGRNGLAKDAWEDVTDGIRANISVGYSISKLERGSSKDTYVAKRWRPVEASLVSIPADVTVGVGRAASEAQPKPVIETNFTKETTMSEVDIAAVEQQARQAAQKNAAQIVELGARHKRSDLASKAIAEGKSIEQFRGELLEMIGSERALEEQSIGMTDKEVKKFSLLRAIHALANPTDRRAQEKAAFEFECSRAAAEQYGRTAQGILLPAEVMRNWKRDLNSTDEASLFGEDYRGNEFIDVLRNSSSVMQAGARMLNGLSGDVKIPKKTAAAQAAWIATEGGASAESEMTVGSVSLTPKTLGAYTDITRQLMIQSSMDVEALVRDDLAQALALAIDLAALAGDGTGGAPTGVKSASGVATTTFGAANPTFAEIVAMESAVRASNVNGNLSYIMPSATVGALKTTEKASGTAQFVYENGGTVNGYRAITSNQVTAGDVYLGDFSQLLVGMFGGLDLVVDPYTNSTSGTVRVVALQSVDTAVRHAEAFCVSNDGV